MAEALEHTDAPFLNRFEKHRFDIDKPFTPHHVDAFRQLEDWTGSLMELASGKVPLISLSHVFPLYTPEYLKLMVLYHDSEESIVNKCKQELLKIASQDVVLLAYAGGMEPQEKAFIQETWAQYHSDSFFTYLSKFSQSSGPENCDKSLVFLYNTDILASEQLSQLPVPTNYQQFSSFRKEQDIAEDIMKFYRGRDQLYILDFNLSKDGAQLVMIKLLVEKISKEMENPQKKVCLLVRLMRNAPINIEVCWFGQWNIRTFTNCREADFVFSNEVVVQSLEEVVRNHPFYKFEEALGKLTLEAYQTFAFQTREDEENGEVINSYIFRMSEQVTTNPHLVAAMRDKLLSLLQKKRWLDDVLCLPECVARASNIPTAICCAVELNLAAVYPKVLYEIERYGAFPSFFVETPEHEVLQRLWLGVFNTLKCDTKLQLTKQSNRMDFGPMPNFPFIRKEYEMLQKVFLESQEQPADQAEIQFLRRYAELSILKEIFDEVNDSRALQDFYFRDLIHFDLATQTSAHNEELLALLHSCWSCDQPTFERKVWMYVQNRLFGLTICEIVEILQTLGLETKTIITRLTEFLEYYEQAEDAAEDNATTALRSVLNVELQTQITKISTSSEWLQYATNLQEAALLLSRLFNSIDCLYSRHEFFLENYDEIDILALCFQVLSRTSHAEDSLRQLQQCVGGVTDGPFLYNDAFSQQLFSIIKTSCSDDYSQHMLSSYLLKLLLYNEMETLPIIAEQLDSEEWQQLKCCSRLVIEVTRIAKLTSIDEWSIVTEIEQSPFVEELERILQEGSASTRFAVLLCDAVYWHLKKGLHFDSAEQAAAIVSEYYDNYRQFCRLLKDRYIAFPWITKVYSSAFLRCFLEAYCKVVHDEIPNFEVQQVSEELDADLFPTARAYVLKYWKYSEKLSIPKLQLIFRQRLLLSWTRHFTFPEQYKEPVPCSQSRYYQCVSLWMAAILSGESVEPLSELVNAADSAENKIEFATAVMMNAYLRLAKGQENSVLEYAFQTAAGLIQRKFGKATSDLINCFINNFPEGSCLRLSAKTSEEDKCRALVLCFALITLNANANFGSPFTSLFLDKEGNIRADVITIVKGSYLCGVGCHPMYAWLQYVRGNFETLKSTIFLSRYCKGSANKCSCGYVYFIDKSGAPMEIRPCPFCGQNIGGKNNIWVERPGHENMTDQEAVKFLEESLARYKRDPETGYWSFDADEYCSQPLRGMAPLAHATLHLLTVLLLRFLNMCGFLSNKNLQELVHSIRPIASPSAHLEEQILNNFANIKAMLNTEDSHLWWYEMLRKFSHFMQSHRDLPCDLASRIRVEADFNVFLQPFSQSPLYIVLREKETATSSGTDALHLLNETNLEEQLRTFPLLHLFRLVSTPDVDSLSGALDLLQLGEQYPLVKLYVQMREDIAKLSMFIPLIEFTNYMKDRFDHRIKREEARASHLADVIRSDPEAERLFENCAAVWSWLECNPVAYECHQLPPKRFSYYDELIYFLVDKQEQGGGMYMAAALLKLAEIQNTVMSGFLAAMEKKSKLSGERIINLKKIPIQALRPENVVRFSLETLEDFNGLFLNNTEYGKGKEVVFNFPRIEEAIQSSFQKGRFLAVDSLEYIYYTYELLSISSSHSDLITNIRTRIPQLPFDSVKSGKIERFLTEAHRQDLDDYYQSLSFMLCFLRNAPVTSDMTLLEFAQTMNKFNVCRVYIMQTPLSVIKIAQVVALYELLEQRLFPYLKQFVKDEFKKTSEEVNVMLSGLNLPSTHYLDLQLAMIRLILRFLIADIDPTHAIALYLVFPDFWAENYDEEQRDNIVSQLRELPLAHAMQVHDFLEKKLNERKCILKFDNA